MCLEILKRTTGYQPLAAPWPYAVDSLTHIGPPIPSDSGTQQLTEILNQGSCWGRTLGCMRVFMWLGIRLRLVGSLSPWVGILL